MDLPKVGSVKKESGKTLIYLTTNGLFSNSLSAQNKPLPKLGTKIKKDLTSNRDEDLPLYTNGGLAPLSFHYLGAFNTV